MRKCFFPPKNAMRRPYESALPIGSYRKQQFLSPILLIFSFIIQMYVTIAGWYTYGFKQDVVL
jgi:hypothetical protein